MASIYDIEFGDIYGAQGAGGQSLSNIVNALVNQLQTAGHFGSEYSGQGQQQSLAQMGLGAFADPGAGWGQTGGWQGMQVAPDWTLGSAGEYDIPGLTGALGGVFGTATEEGSYFGGLGEDVQGGMAQLLSILQGAGMQGLGKEYGQGMADVRGEIGAQMGGLRGGLTGGKGSRYGGLGTMGRNLQGGRQKYLSDYYGLQEQQAEMQQGLQEEMESGFMGNIANWMAMNPYVS